jgi:hypothetical protein
VSGGHAWHGALFVDAWLRLCSAFCCSKIAQAEAAVSVKENKCLVMHMHVQRILSCNGNWCRVLLPVLPAAGRVMPVKTAAVGVLILLLLAFEVWTPVKSGILSNLPEFG